MQCLRCDLQCVFFASGVQWLSVELLLAEWQLRFKLSGLLLCFGGGVQCVCLALFALQCYWVSYLQ